MVIPKELRRTMNIDDKAPIEIFTDGENIVLKKYVPSNACVSCPEIENTSLIKGKYICHNCAEQIVEIAKG